MRYYELTEPRHPAKRERPRDIASLFVRKPEWTDLRAICEAYGPIQIVGVEKVPLIPAFMVEVLCRDPDTAVALSLAWHTYCETSPHRPHGLGECLAWGEQYNPFPDIPREWTF
jgi:hypothetical protein